MGVQTGILWARDCSPVSWNTRSQLEVEVARPGSRYFLVLYAQSAALIGCEQPIDEHVVSSNSALTSDAAATSPMGASTAWIASGEAQPQQLPGWATCG